MDKYVPKSEKEEAAINTLKLLYPKHNFYSDFNKLNSLNGAQVGFYLANETTKLASELVHKYQSKDYIDYFETQMLNVVRIMPGDVESIEAKEIIQAIINDYETKYPVGEDKAYDLVIGSIFDMAIMAIFIRRVIIAKFGNAATLLPEEARKQVDQETKKLNKHQLAT